MSSLRFIIKQQWTIEEIYIFSKEGGSVGHNFERDPPRTIPARFGLIRFRGFRGEDLNVKVYDVRRTDAKSSPGLWPGELKSSSFFLRSNIFALAQI